jgi:hypothetical protein
MNPNEINKRIAIACGWKDIQRGPYDGALFGRQNTHQLRIVPDYHSDLNAMHEAEKMLSEKQWDTFELNVWGCKIHATAPQRAEAFLRTIGQWEETK